MSSRSRLSTAVAPLAVLVMLIVGACGDGQAASRNGVSASELSSSGGCGGPTFFAVNGDDTAILVIRAHELFGADELSSRTVDLPHDEVDVRYLTGTHVTGHTCDDAPEQSAQVDHTYRPTSGRLDFDFDIADPFENSRGSVTVTGLELTSTNGDTVALEAVAIIGVPVGTMTG